MVRVFFKIFLFLFLVNFSYGQGLLFSNQEDLRGGEKTEENLLGFVEDDIPYRYSLRKYAPRPQNQEGQSCVGWASSFSALSIMYNVMTNTTDDKLKSYAAFDPYYIYSTIKTFDEDETCDMGLNIPRALNTLVKYGSKKWFLPNPPDFIENLDSLWCDDRWNFNSFEKFSKNNSKPYAPDEWFYLLNNKGKYRYLNYIKNLISNERKVILIGVNLRNSIWEIEDDGYWNPSLNEESIGGHAMTIIGYDNNKFGGSFEIMNSYGSDFGENGFLWIPYDKFYSLIVERQYEDDEGDIITLFYFEFNENKFSNTNPLILSDNTYRVKFDNKIYDGNFNKLKNYMPSTWINSSKFNGYGQYIFANKDIYIGEFTNDYFDGSGYYYDYSEDKLAIVTYKNGELIHENELGFAIEDEINSDRVREYLFKYFKNIDLVLSEDIDIQKLSKF